MKNETALQIIVRLLKNHDVLVKKCPEVLEVIESYYDIEQKQIVDAWQDGQFIGKNGFILENYGNGEEYFTDKFKNDSYAK